VNRTQVLAADADDAVLTALRHLRTGELVAFPTDTVYGLGALVFDEQAVQSIYVAKGRSEDKAIPVLVGDPLDLEQVASSLSPAARQLADRFWPGPLTIIVQKRPDLPAAVSATGTVGVRLPDHPVARALLKASGPLAVTSANLSGQPSPRTAGEVLQQLDGCLSLILDGGPTPGGTPSTVVDCTGGQPRILRAGPVTLDQIMEALG
jgi:L-threonylcarbamoyladenylate synthase